MRKTRSTRNSKNKFHWNKVQRFSIRKFSFGVASCMIGAQFVLSGLPNTVEAAFKQLNGEDGIVSLYSNSGETPESANGIEIGSKVNVDKEIGIDVDWSEYTRENPIVKVTYTYNGGADGSSVTGFGGHRPRFWFTTPIGLKEPKEITLKKNDGRPVYVMESWNRNKKFGSLSNSINSRFQTEDDINRAYTTPDFHGNDTKWESYNETTGEPYREYSGSFANKFWYHIGDRVSDNASEQALFEKFRTDTKTIYVDWERGGIERATITAVYEVADPTFGNDRRTLEFGAGFRVGIARMMQHYKTVLAPVPSLYKLNEIFEPDVPSRIAVTNPKSLTTEEKNTIKAKILEANKNNVTTVHRTAKNKLVENLFSDEETSIEIGADGKATIRYADNTIDEIPGTSLVYERPQINNNETTEGKIGDYKYLKNPFEVDDINNLKDTDVESAKSKFYTVNKMTIGKNVFDEDVITAVGDPSKTSEDFKNKRFEIDKSTGIGSFFSGSTPIGVNIPKDHLFKQKPQKTFNIDEARQDAEKAIDNLTYLSPNEKQNFKTELASKTTQDDLNTVVNNAIAKNSSNEKALEAKKRDAKEAINNNPYLTNAQKKELTDKVSAVVMTDPTEGTATPIEHTKGLIDKILDEALDKTKEKAKAIIDEIDKKDGKAGYLTDPTVDAYKERIKNAPSQAEITKIIGEAQAQVSKKAHDAEKAKTDALKDEYKKKIDQVPGLTDAQKDEYKKQIDAATTRDQLEAIVKDAEVKAYRDTAKAKIDALEHLNAAQKAELKTQVDAAGSKAEVDNIVSIAQGLDSKMDSLQKLVAEAEKVKASDKYTNPNVPQDKKTAFDTAKDAASKVADKTTAEPENAAGTSEVATLIDNLAKAIKELTGRDVAVPVSKDALKAEIDLNKDDAVKKSPAYAKEKDAAKKKAYDDALAKAQEVFAKKDATQPQVDEALDKLQQARLALSGKAEDFTLAVTEAAKISKEPKAGESLTEQADKDAVKAKVTANGKALDNTYAVEYGAIAEKGDKKVVPVTVTHDGITRTVDVPVEGNTAATTTPTADTAKLSETPVKDSKVTKAEDVQKVKEAVKVPEGTQVTDKKLLEEGKVVEGTDQSANGGANNAGKLVVKVEVTYGDGSKDVVEVPVEGTDAAKATPKLKEEITSGEVPVSVDPATDKKVAEADKKEITEAVVVPEGQPQPTDKQVKDDGAIVEGTGANAGKKVVVVEVTYPDGSKDEIEVPVRKATDKDKAKADLTKAADAEKAEIDEDNALSKKEKEALKKQVDTLKAKHEENINNATSPEDIASATEKGRQEIAAVHTPQDITETAKRRLNPPKEKVKVTDINHLTDEEKDAVKKAIVATNPSLEESEVLVDDKGNVSSPKGILEAEKVVTQALNKPATPVVVADPNHLTDEEKETVKKAVVDANPGLNKDDITVDEKGNVTTKNGDKLLAKDVVTPALKKPTTPVVVENPASLTDKEKENIQNAVAEANKDSNLKPGDVTVNPDGSVTTPKGNLPKEDVVTTVLNKPNKLVEVQNPNSLTVKEKELVKKAVAEANPGLTEDKIKVDDQGNVTTPKGNLPAKDVVTSTLKKPTTPVEVKDPNNLTEKEKEDVKKAVIEANPGLDKKDIKVDDQGNVETPKGNLPSEDVVAPSLKKPTTKVIVKDPNNLTDGEKEAIKDAVVAVNPDLADKKDKIKVDNQGNVETPNGNLPKEDVVTIVLNKPANPVVVSNPNSLTDEEKDKVKDAVAKANPGLDKKDIEVDNQGNVKTPNGGLPAKDVITSALKKPTTPVKVNDPSKLTEPEKSKVVEEIIKNNPGLTDKDIKVDDQGNVETPKGNLPAGDVVTPVLNVPTKPIVVGNSESLTEKEKEAVKDAVAEANPGLDKKVITVDDKGNVTTPKGNIPTEYIVKASKGASVTRSALPELSIQDAIVAGEVAVEKGKALTDEDILKQLTLVEGVTAKVTSKPATTEIGTKEAEVEVTLADGRKVTVKVPVVVYEGERPEVNDLAKAKEDAKKQVEDAAKAKIAEINNNKELTAEQKQKAEDAINKAKEDANKQIENASSAGTAKAIGKEAAENIQKFDPKANPAEGVKPVDPSKLDEEKAKAIAEIEQAAKDQTDAIKNNAGLTQEQKDKAIKKIEDLKAKAIENVRKATTKEEVAKVVNDVEKDIKKVNPQPIPTPQPQPQPQPGNNGENSGTGGNNTGNTSNQNAQANSDAVEYAKQAAKNILEEAARAKKAQLEEAGLSDAEKEELFAKVDAEKQAALDEIAKAKDVDTVKQLVTKAVAKIKAIQPARNAQDNQDSQDAQNVQNAQNAQDAQNHSNSNPTSLDAANVRGQELPATGTGSEFVVFNAAAISILTGLGLAIPSKKKETEK